MPLPEGQSPKIVTEAQFDANKPADVYFIASGDNPPGRPPKGRWTFPTYYDRPYTAVFKGFPHNLAVPKILKEKHFDPISHQVIHEVDVPLYSPERIFRPRGTYISIFVPTGAQLTFDADKDFGDTGV